MVDVRKCIDALTMACQANPTVFTTFLEQSSVLFQISGYDMETVLLTSLAQAFRAEKHEDIIDYLRQSIPMLSLLNAASRYASRMPDPREFTWEEFFTHLITK